MELNAIISIFQLKSYKRLLYLKLVKQTHFKKCKNKITHHYHMAIDYLLNVAFPNSIYFMVFEDDLIIAPDTINYFYAHTALLEKENPDNPNSEKSSIWCISAWNDHGYLHTSLINNLVYRVDGWPGLGWIAKASLFKKELLPKWPLHGGIDWDIWLRSNSVKNNRVCLVPDMPRTFHFGEHGKNMNPEWHEAYYMRKKIYNHQNSNKLISWQPVNKLSKNTYELELEDSISKSIKLDENSICKENFHELIKNDKNYVIRVNEESNIDQVLPLFTCLKIWDLDIRGLYMGVLRIHYKERPLVVVFCNLNVRFCAF